MRWSVILFSFLNFDWNLHSFRLRATKEAQTNFFGCQISVEIRCKLRPQLFYFTANREKTLLLHTGDCLCWSCRFRERCTVVPFGAMASNARRYPCWMGRKGCVTNISTGHNVMMAEITAFHCFGVWVLRGGTGVSSGCFCLPKNRDPWVPAVANVNSRPRSWGRLNIWAPLNMNTANHTTVIHHTIDPVMLIIWDSPPDQAVGFGRRAR